MTKSSKIRIALTVLALAAFTAIFFSIPALRIKRFWFAYGCGVFAILWQIYAIAVTDGKKNTADHYYGYPTARLGLYYMVLLAFPIIGFITTRTLRKELARQAAKAKAEAAA